MLNQNEKFHSGFQEKFTGKGLRIVVFEFNDTPDPRLLKNLDVQQPFDMMDTSPFDPSKDAMQHCVLTCGVYRNMLPDAEIFLLPQNNDGFKWAFENDIHIANASIYDAFADDELEEALSKKTLCICSAGNTTNSPDESILAKKSYWTSISAVHLNVTDNSVSYQFPDYASYGAGAIDFTSFSNIEIPQIQDRAIGTSFSGPFGGSLMGQLMCAFKEKFSYFPDPELTLKFLKRIATPVLGRQLLEGSGLIKLPNLDTYDFGMEMQLYRASINDNGKIIPKDVAPVVMKNRTLVPVSWLPHIGLDYHWNESKKSIFVLK